MIKKREEKNMNFLKNIAEKAKSVADSPTRSLGLGDEPGPGGAGSQEGFICPLCLASFPAPEDLQRHYEACPMVDIAQHSPGTEKR